MKGNRNFQFGRQQSWIDNRTGKKRDKSQKEYKFTIKFKWAMINMFRFRKNVSQKPADF